MSEVHSYESLLAWGAEQRALGLRIGFTCGAFDLLHAGHVDYLEKAAGLGDRLLVAVNSDASIQEYKNPLRPIVPEEQRARLVGALRAVDAVTIMRETRPAKLISLLKPDVYIKGGDYQVENLRSAPLVKSYGGTCAVIPVAHATSTSSLIGRIAELSVYETPAQIQRKRDVKGLVLLDRDGTLIDNVPFLRDPASVRLRPHVGDGLRALQDAGFALAIVTNQQGLGLGYFDYGDFVRVNSQMFRLLAAFGVRISRFYFCPHSFDESCACRKPAPALLQQALRHFGTEPRHCFMIGDTEADMQAAEGAGCHGILIGPTAQIDGKEHYRSVADFGAAAHFITGSLAGSASGERNQL